MSTQNLPVVTIIGRPNVGKSSLFNQLVGRRVSIVHRESGVTRDQVIMPIRHQGHHFLVADTGGLGIFTDEKKVSVFDDLIRTQVATAIEESDCLIWVVDSNTGVTPLDQEIGRLLHQKGADKVIIAANKADNAAQAEAAANEFADLSFQPLIPLSCSHKRGLKTLLDNILTMIPHAKSSEIEETGMKLAVAGRPNVGKSSLINALLGEKRVMVSAVAGTTRDAVDIPIEIRDDNERALFTLIDTAGLRQKRRVDNAVELFSVMRAENAVKRSDVTIFVLDGNSVGSTQDRRIARLIDSENKPCIIVANKWDLAGQKMKMRQLRKEIENSLPFMQHAPVIALCATSGYNLDQLLASLFTLRRQAAIKIPTSLLNQYLHDIFARTPPPAEGNRRLKFFYGTMVKNPPPHFLLFVNDKTLCRAGYRHFIENQLQSIFFPKSGLPVSVEMRSRRPSATISKAASKTKSNSRPASSRRRVSRKKGK